MSDEGRKSAVGIGKRGCARCARSCRFHERTRQRKERTLRELGYRGNQSEYSRRASPSSLRAIVSYLRQCIQGTQRQRETEAGQANQAASWLFPLESDFALLASSYNLPAMPTQAGFALHPSLKRKRRLLAYASGSEYAR